MTERDRVFLHADHFILFLFFCCPYILIVCNILFLQVMSDEAILRVSPAFHEEMVKNPGQSWELRFQLNRTPLRRCHLAVRISRPLIRSCEYSICTGAYNVGPMWALLAHAQLLHESHVIPLCHFFCFDCRCGVGVWSHGVWSTTEGHAAAQIVNKYPQIILLI